MEARLRRLAAACAAIVVAVSGGLALPGAGGADPTTAELRARDAALAERSAAAVLQLYAAESAIDRARTEVAAAQARVAEIERERAAVAHRLQVARRTLAVAQSDLADRLRALYVQGDAHPLEVLLGAQSLDAAITGLDGLEFAAEADRDIIARTRVARNELAAAGAALAERAERLRAAVAAATDRVAALERARAERAAHLGSLRRERRLNAAQIATLERRAAAARARAQELAAQPPAAVGDAAPAGAAVPASAEPPPATPAPPPAEGRRLVVSATGYAIRGRTATGLPTAWGVAAVDPAVIPLGTRFLVPGYGEAVAADVGPAVRGAEIDLWFPTRAQALAWGRRAVTITLR